MLPNSPLKIRVWDLKLLYLEERETYQAEKIICRKCPLFDPYVFICLYLVFAYVYTLYKYLSVFRCLVLTVGFKPIV